MKKIYSENEVVRIITEHFIKENDLVYSETDGETNCVFVETDDEDHPIMLIVEVEVLDDPQEDDKIDFTINIKG